MSPLELIRLLLVVVHVVGSGAIIGAFILQMPSSRTRLDFSSMLVGSIMQLVSGVALIVVRRLADLEVLDVKMGVKMLITVAVLALVIVALVRQRRKRAAGADDASLRSLLYSAGVLAIVNVFIAVFWR